MNCEVINKDINLSLSVSREELAGIVEAVDSLFSESVKKQDDKMMRAIMPLVEFKNAIIASIA